ncbi:MAG TPA: efflux RND transporter periplasmic adaptor subunit [Candidatus Angelobacter sp.]|nr:efflux RND transporter periplasmic adaptor subunit [Candidatus Angelobacter sp.]
MRFLIGTVLAGLALLVSGCGSNGNVSSAASKSAAAPPDVTVAMARQEQVPIEINAIGNAQPYRTVQVKSLVDGQIIRVDFQQGDKVRAGQLLFELDKRPFQAALDQALGKLAQDQATAANNKAMAARANELLKQGVLAVQDVQTTTSQAQASAAAVQADKAAVETAKVNLGYTDIHAPISGKAGAILVNLGNLVKANDTNPLTTINQVEPIYVSFNIPEAELAALRAKGTDHLKVTAAPPNQQNAAQGTLSFIDNAVDATTGTIRLMGTFTNRDQKLVPGEYLNVQLVLGVDPNAVVVPTTAVQSGQQGKFVYVVQPDGTAVATPVNTSRNYQQLAVISSGLTPGKSVIVDGQDRVVPNAKVNVVRTVQTAPSPATEANAASPAGESE